jgi:hypothetical protein
MKKIIYYILGLLLIPAISFATSGACSGHGGVNCSAGRDSDGSVICYDGWRNSSVNYSSMVMCAQSSVVAPVSQPTKIITPIESTKTLPTLQPRKEFQSTLNKVDINPASVTTTVPTPKHWYQRLFSWLF